MRRIILRRGLRFERVRFSTEDAERLEALTAPAVVCTPLQEYITNLERDPVMKARIDEARARLRRSWRWRLRRLLGLRS